jgi:hypothetical protein
MPCEMDGVFCTECGKECAARCPFCGVPVHSYYGFMNLSCGAAHETKCARARAANQPIDVKKVKDA